jgi:hypothetical protein
MQKKTARDQSVSLIDPGTTKALIYDYAQHLFTPYRQRPGLLAMAEGGIRCG